MSDKEKTILVSGAFNPLHFGHLLLLRDASKYGKVIVALNSDEWVIKNKGYLLFDFETRKSLLEECQHVSEVIPFDDEDGDVVYALFEVRPTYFGNGGSATSLSLPKEELQVCGYLGIEPVFNLGDTAKDIDNKMLVSAQKSIINHANREINNLKRCMGSKQ
jgi:cytidyltransferase-like protein